MRARDSYQYIQIGLALRLLRNVSENTSAKLVVNTVDALQKLLDKCAYPVSIASTKSLSFMDIEEEFRALDEKDKIGSALSKKIANEFKTLESVVFAEASTKKLFVLSERRFNTEYLLSQPDKLLKAGTFDKLSEIARLDLASATRCILFGEATAAAFHMLRATEATLKSYYCHHRKQKRLEKPMWGNMVDQLKAKKTNRPPEALLQSLDLIRTAYRNPTQHPQAIYQIDSAQDLLGVCLDVIGKMADEL